MTADDVIKVIDHVVMIVLWIAVILWLAGAFDKDSG